jgi:hypothetical protein
MRGNAMHPRVLREQVMCDLCWPTDWPASCARLLIEPEVDVGEAPGVVEHSVICSRLPPSADGGHDQGRHGRFTQG